MPLRILEGCLLGILCFQLTAISLTPSIPTISIGQFSDKTIDALAYEPSATHYDALIFTGDIMLGRHVERLMKREGSEYPFRGIALHTIVESSRPAVIGNFEASIPTVHKPTPNYTLRFSVASSALSSLTTAGFTHLSLANNHSYDYGNDGYMNAWKQMNDASLTPFGSEVSVSTSSVAYLDTSAGTVALIGINVSDAPADYDAMQTILAKAGETSDIQIVYIHWGLEYALVHHQSQKQLATWLVSQNVDLIIGHHPHVVQDIDIIEGVPVFYSLGNYVFDQYFSKDVQEGLVVSLKFSSDNATLELHPITSMGYLSQPRLQTDLPRERFLAKLASRSNRSLQGQILTGNIVLDWRFASSTKTAMITQ